eukprot:347241-Chlamydomonas_euryale.AAC.14
MQRALAVLRTCACWKGGQGLQRACVWSASEKSHPKKISVSLHNSLAAGCSGIAWPAVHRIVPAACLYDVHTPYFRPPPGLEARWCGTHHQCGSL